MEKRSSFATYLLALVIILVVVIGCFGCDEKKKEKSKIEIWAEQQQAYHDAAVAFSLRAFSKWHVDDKNQYDSLNRIAECLDRSADSVWLLIQQEKVNSCNCLKQK